MKVGVPVWIGDHRVYDKLARLYERGMEYVEVSIDYPLPYRDERGLLDAVKKAKDELGVEVAFHLPWRDVSLSSPIPHVRSASLRTIIDSVERTLRYDPAYYNLHLSTLEHVGLESVWDEVLRASAESLREIVRAIGGTSALLVENNDGRIFHTPDHFSFLAAAVEDVCFCFDAGHAIVAEHRVSAGEHNTVREVLAAWARTYPKGRLIAIHAHGVTLHASYRRPLDHTLFTNSIVSLDEVLSAFKSHRIEYLNLEVFRADPEGAPVGLEELEGLIVEVKGMKRWAA